MLLGTRRLYLDAGGFLLRLCQSSKRIYTLRLRRGRKAACLPRTDIPDLWAPAQVSSKGKVTLYAWSTPVFYIPADQKSSILLRIAAFVQRPRRFIR